MFHKFVDFNGVMILVLSVNGETNGTDKSPIFAVGIDADKGRILSMRMTVVGFDEIPKAFGELLYV